MDLGTLDIEERGCPRCGLIYKQATAKPEYAFDVTHDNCPRCMALDPNRTGATDLTVTPDRATSGLTNATTPHP